ncbi:uncharacterized protein V1513DRAFT_432953 [Lipomyces chichibuensis]|uniref:uncharacterized protein n=1 Tax=Lipomyces chichibuensis TaxID=1546026 RepID=UPI003343E690
MAIASHHSQYSRGRSTDPLPTAGHAADNEFHQGQWSSQHRAAVLRRNSFLSTSSLSSVDDESVYEAEVFFDEDSLDRIQYIDPHAVDKDDSSKLYTTTTNGSVAASTAIHPPPEDDGTLANNPCARRIAPEYASNRNSLVLGSPSSGNLFRGIDYSEYTYDLGWTAASRIHSRNSSLFQTQSINFANASPRAFGSPGFGSPGFLAQHIAENEAESLRVENGNAESSTLRVDDVDEVVTENAPLLNPSSEPITIAGSGAENGHTETILPTESEGLPVLGTSPMMNFLAHPCMSEDGEQYPDTDLATLIDYASPRVAPFPSTAEAEELLYSRMSPQSRAALSKLMRGRHSTGPRPPRFRPPISQNMGYGAIQRHPFYYAPSRSSSNARSVMSEPGATPQPAYRRLNRTLHGEFGNDDIGFWDSLKSFVLTECCFCLEAARD